MWTNEIVKLRFMEAADIERRMVVKGGPASGGAAWPAYYHDEEDMAGWDDQTIEDNLERTRKITASPELTRWEEVFFEWTLLIPQPRRVLVWRWAQCIVNKRSFSEWCDRKGIVRRTAYNRIEKVWDDLARRFGNEGRLLRAPDAKWSSQQTPAEASNSHTMGEVTRSPRCSKSPTSFLSERSHDALTTPEAVDEFAQHLANVNEERRKARLRKALRGVPGEQAAA
ncbi:hypothetical protein [Bradyrhizobium sp. SZCCHNRI1002]|uniref:hypothetical protein n=1 Tax=Bradyrhizobium sp. SZCCHNRI1002 TaxID=3057274 RepID=UPI0028EF8A07|nr:hypothetical protein [Bradyrhizobium sp. SZCCHNRI1002]